MAHHYDVFLRLAVSCLAPCLVALGLVSSASAVPNGLISDFQSGTPEFWRRGAASPQPIAEADSGPLGVGDFALRNITSGVGAGSRQVIFNTAQWTGSFIGIPAISGAMRADAGGPALMMRVAIDGLGGRFATANAFALPNDGAYHAFVINILPSDFTAVGGTNLNLTLNSASVLRLLHSPIPAWQGASVATTLHFDNLTAGFGGGLGVGVPEPTTLALMGLGLAGMGFSRRRRIH